MSLDDVVERVLAYQSNPPSGEANTCIRVILPALRAAGYHDEDFDAEAPDRAGGKPDYTVLPGTNHCWFLEAKAWGVPLDERHAMQALDYVNRTDRWYVVLSNGNTWRLYDNRVQGAPEDRLMAQAGAQDPDGLRHMLSALSKESVLAGGLERYAMQARLSVILRQHLLDPSSSTVRQLRSSLRTAAGLGSLQPCDITAHFSTLYGTPAAPVPPTQTPAVTVCAAMPAALAPAGSAGTPLEALASDIGGMVTGRKPAAIVLPDGTEHQVSTWKAVALEVIRWALQQDARIPLPFRGRTSGKLYFLNAAPLHETGAAMRSHDTVTVGPYTLYVDTWRSAGELISGTTALCEAVGIAPSSIAIRTVQRTQP